VREKWNEIPGVKEKGVNVKTQGEMIDKLPEI